MITFTGSLIERKRLLITICDKFSGHFLINFYPVRLNSCRVFSLNQKDDKPHHVSNVTLLMDSMNEMRHGPPGHDRHIFASMSLAIQRYSGLLIIIFMLCKCIDNKRSYPEI